MDSVKTSALKPVAVVRIMRRGCRVVQELGTVEGNLRTAQQVVAAKAFAAKYPVTSGISVSRRLKHYS